MRLIKINHTHFVMAKTITITCFMAISDNKINSLETSLTKDEANLGEKNNSKLIKIGEIKHSF